MRDIEEKIAYIYFNIDSIYYFFSNNGTDDHSKRCVLRRFFILIDSYIEMISYFKNDLFRRHIIDQNTKKNLENTITSIRSEWDKKYEVIRNKLSAHHQDMDTRLLIEWWNEINYSTLTYFYEGMNEVRDILLHKADFLTLTPVDFSDIDFTNTCLQDKEQDAFYLAHDRLAQTKKNTCGTVGNDEFEKKCSLILSIIDFIFIDCTVTLKTENYQSYYKNLLFDSSWLLLCCDIFSLIENMYCDGTYGKSLITICPMSWKGIEIIENSNVNRNETYEETLKDIRNRLAAHIDTDADLKDLLELFYGFDLKQLHKYGVYHLQAFQHACHSDDRTKKFSFLDQKLSTNINLPYSSYRPVSD